MFKIAPQKELAPEASVDLAKLRAPQYGRYLDDFVPDQVFVHPRGYTFEAGEMRAFATTFMQCNPLYLNASYAEAHGFASIPASPQHVFNVLLSLGVQNNSEKAMANLGYYNARFLRPVYAGDTLRAMTKVVSQRDRGADKPGIVHVMTLGLNQRDEVVAQYERKIMIKHRPEGEAGLPAPSGEAPAFPWQAEPSVDAPLVAPKRFAELTASNTYLEDFAVGDIIAHANGRTITDEHVNWTYRVGNTHPLHYDAIYSRGLSGKMSGEPIVYGGLVFSWLEGLTSRDVGENALWELGFTEGYHTQPSICGETVAAISRVLAVDPAPEGLDVPAGVVTFQLIGVKNIKAAEAVEKHGADLFIKEGAKKKLGKEKIADKIFEIERQLLIKRRP
ncbi:MAG: acyl dehydratase [Proteobacteria bacterium]|nr:MAG: acyl dehydratase [Pseudomonadota bacterium]